MSSTSAPLINRELSWVEFNRRVLQEAADPSHPPLERAKFLAIFATNLDEFYMIRVSGLKAQRANDYFDGADGLTPAQILEQLNAQLAPMVNEHSRLWRDEICPLLTQHGVCVIDAHEMNEDQRTFANEYFRRTVFPVLTPLAFDPGHPFPHISNLSLSLAVAVEDERGRTRFARVKVPPSLPRLLQLNECSDESEPCERCFVWLDQIIAANITSLFHELRVLGVYEFRVTRDADIEISEDEAGDLRDSVERSVKERGFLDVVRLEVDHEMPSEICGILMENLNLRETDVQRIEGPIDLSKLWEIYRLNVPQLKDPPFTPRTPPKLADGIDIFAEIRKSDVLLHHPYDSFTPVVNFIRTAARDPHVLAIKQTLYRVGPNSPIVQALIEAAQNGKQVAAMVELKARFDEENNLEWARRLEAVGAHVVFGIPGLKVHSKVLLVVRREGDEIRRYVHLSTGNYNAASARVYTDLGFFTCSERIGEDASDLFNFLTGYSRQRAYKELFVAPVTLRQQIAERIEREIQHHRLNSNGRIAFKMNALVDPEMITLLYKASMAGVKIDLLVRGMCSLRPGVPGMSENIRVISVVGRFLEHSRVYWFHNDGKSEIYLGSADLMERNLDRRVETLFPIHDPVLVKRIVDEVLDLGLADNVKSHELGLNGQYHKITSQGPQLNSQMILLKASD
ncbi:MAG: polyphosphate kinase 1 [Chloroflexi bacterium]|nr:polyphosphate kinase 1 [Chloroflexota bacterium]